MAEEPTSSSSVPSYIGAAIFSVFLIIILFVVIFGLLQARSRKKLCWQQGYEKLPMYYANGAMTTALPKDRDYVDEDSEVDEFVKDNTECS
ncbi:unnamed protein product [Owenia fusiformis]|uniref:Uncharacterized protein n=1 Tax=Owenia fusiformis TaxID=6347 RepID=A0A8S4PTW9_OWEFU|nr:unnamed protein product [Owenia fusiformis]